MDFVHLRLPTVGRFSLFFWEDSLVVGFMARGHRVITYADPILGRMMYLF